MIVICNLRNCKPSHGYDIRVDRTNKVLGNKFYMRSERDRDFVCDKYEEWFNTQIKSRNQEVLEELRRLYRVHQKYGQLRLFCWCAPKRCHSETIKKFLEQYL